jgi:hypothetical protein
MKMQKEPKTTMPTETFNIHPIRESHIGWGMDDNRGGGAHTAQREQGQEQHQLTAGDGNHLIFQESERAHPYSNIYP